MRPPLWVRWVRFNLAGALGVMVQLGALKLFAEPMGYLWATALAVELAVLHNFAWHERMTWRERTGGAGGAWQRLLRFHLANAVISVAGNLALMRMLVGTLGVELVLANLLAIVACSVLNFAAGEWFVFRAPERTYPEDRERLFI